MLSPTERDKIRAAFLSGQLKVRSVSPTAEVQWKQVLAVHRAEVLSESIWEAHTERGPMVLTGGHRVFTAPTEKMEMENLRPGQTVLGVLADTQGEPVLLAVQQIEGRRFMYDLTADDWHNFVLHRSGVVVSNSPDRNYHFRPPEHEGTIGCYNQVFGFVWTDEELLCYLQVALDWWNSFPPETESLCTLDLLVQNKAVWKTAVLWGAMVHALMALSINWVHEEFDYSIGGISLSIDRSSKYESLKSNSEGQFDKATEAKAKTTKFIRGLSQSRFGIGVRSSFGPHVGAGILSPRRFL